MIFRVIIFLMLWISSGLGDQIIAQTTDAYDIPGMPYFHTYTPRDYPGGQQNRWVVQWHDKTMLFANNGGLLQHGDTHWRILRGDEVKFLSVLLQSNSDKNKLWAGSYSNIGYFEKSDSSLFEYHSLTELLPDSLRSFSNISKIAEFNGRVFFYNDINLLAYDKNNGKVGLPSEIHGITNNTTRIIYITVWRDQLYIFLDNQTILEIDANNKVDIITINNLPDQFVASEQWGRKLLLGDASKGLFLFDGNSLEPFETLVKPYISEHKLNDIAVFENEKIAVATDDGGTVILNPDGSLDVLLANKTGLAENKHNNLYIDQNQDLWIAGNENITKVHTGVPLRHLNGSVFGFGDAVQFYEGEEYFYVATMNGLYRYNSKKQALLDSNPENLFTRMGSIATPFWKFDVVDDALWTVGNAGVFEINESGLEILFDKEVYSMRRLSDSKMLMVTFNGVDLIKKIDGSWIDKGAIDVVAFFVYESAVSNDSTFWAGGVQGQLAKVTYDKINDKFELKYYTEADGLFPSEAYEPVFLNGKVFINSLNGHMIYDEENDNFRPFEGLNRELGGWGEFLSQDKYDNYWSLYVEDDHWGIVKMVPESDSTWKRTPSVFELSIDNFGDFIEIDDQRIWVGSAQSIMYKDLYEPVVTSQPTVEIWQVKSLFDQEVLSLGHLPERIAYEQKQIQIDLASSSFRYPEKNQYRYRINDGNWSEWRSNPGIVVDKSFPGNYELVVQTKDFMGQISEPNQFSFAIIAPWYFSQSAFFAYGLLFIAGIFVSVRGLSNYRIRRELSEIKIKEAEKLIEIDAMKDRLFANISHEFRTPLTISHGLVKKALQQLSDGEKNEIEKRDLYTINRNMIRLSDMVNQIIDLTKSDQDYLRLKQNYYSAGKLTSLSVESFRSLAEYHGHHFQFTDNTKNAVLFVDRAKVEIMINNLISNAIKFTPDGGNIIIKSEVKEGKFVLTVADDGPGIPAGDEEEIFERFYRIERAEEDYVEGMGVGLELSRTLARLHSGEIIAKPDQPRGSIFVLTLPIAETNDTTPVVQLEDFESDYELPKQRKVEVNKLAKLKKNTLQILLVEDNADMRSYVEGILTNLGEVTTAADGEEGLAIIRTNSPDLIITDLMMPNMDGKTFVQKLAAHDRWKDIPVIVLTAKALQQDKTDLLRIGVVDYITKPFEPEQLVLKSRNLLNFYQNRLDAREELTNDEEDETLTRQLVEYIREHISDSNLTVDYVVSAFPQSRRSLYRNIRKETGMSASELIREVRLTTARELIYKKTEAYRLEELSAAVGYKSATSFRKMYEERFGEHPLSSRT